MRASRLAGADQGVFLDPRMRVLEHAAGGLGAGLVPGRAW